VRNRSASGIIVILLSVLLAAGCKIFFSEPVQPAKVKISDGRQLDSNWLEIVPPVPLKTVGKIHFVGLKLPNIKGWADEKQQKLRLTDGSEIKIEVELIDENDRPTTLFPNGFGSGYVEFGMRTDDREKPEKSFFPIGAKFEKIRLRSDRPVTAEEIVWAEFEF
jgi:hypothetical protein